MLFKCLPSERAHVVNKLGEPYKEKLTPDGLELRLYFDEGKQVAPAPDKSVEDLSKLTKAALVARNPELSMSMSKAAMLTEMGF